MPTILKYIARLNTLVPGSNHDPIQHSYSSAPLESIACISHFLFCELFSKKEFASYEYASDLDKYWGTQRAPGEARWCALGSVPRLPRPTGPGFAELLATSALGTQVHIFIEVAIVYSAIIYV